MKNVHNALSDVVSMYKGNTITYEIIQHIEEDRLWVVNVYNSEADGSLLQLEVINNYELPVCCVLQKVNVGRKSMCKFMDRLVDALED